MTRILPKPHLKRAESGFTLVELAIVLVIIGLIIGGVLVGQDLIRAATIRSVVTDVEKINAAATTFRNKYNGVPGDLMYTRATDYGLNASLTDGNRTGAAGRGDGNNIVEACGANINGLGCETGLFWTDLSTAGLLPYRLVAYTSVLATTTANTAATYLPKTKLRDTALVSIFNSAGRNWLAIGASNNAAIATAGSNGLITYASDTTSAAVTPLEARNIDEKIDDGLARTGTMVAMAAGTDPTALNGGQAAAGANLCALTSNGSYIVNTDAFANNVACAVTIRTSF